MGTLGGDGIKLIQDFSDDVKDFRNDVRKHQYIHCPKCKEKINIRAHICPHCQYDFSKISIEEYNRLYRWQKAAKKAVLIISIIIGLIVWINSSFIAGLFVGFIAFLLSRTLMVKIQNMKNYMN